MEDRLEMAAAEARRRYQREWRRKNRDKVKKYNDNFWKRKAAQQLEKEAQTHED